MKVKFMLRHDVKSEDDYAPNLKHGDSSIDIENTDRTWTHDLARQALESINPLLTIGDYVEHTDLETRLISAIEYLESIRSQVSEIPEIKIATRTQDSTFVYHLIALFKGFLDQCSDEATQLEIYNLVPKSKGGFFKLQLDRGGNALKTIPGFSLPDCKNYAIRGDQAPEEIIVPKVDLLKGIPSEIKADFLETLEKSPPTLQCRRLLRYPGLHPNKKVEAGGRKFWISQVCDSSDEQSGYEAVLYTVDQGQMVGRLCWYSSGMGQWFVTDQYQLIHTPDPKNKRVVEQTIYKKGTGKSYTQEMQCCHELAEALQGSLQLQTEKPLIPIKNIFYIACPPTGAAWPEEYVNNPELASQNAHSRLESQISLHPFSQRFKNPRQYPPGRSFCSNSFDLSKFAKKAGDISEALIPDFSRAPIYTTEKVKSMLGDVRMEAYEVELNGTVLVWEMQYDQSGRVWVRRIYDKNSPVNSFGVYEKVIDSGAITNKPMEYFNQTGKLLIQADLKMREDGEVMFVDITPALDALKPIKKFRAQRGIKRPDTFSAYLPSIE